MTLRRVLAEPLLHFFVAGVLLFVLFGVLNRGALQSPDEIVVDENRVAALRAQFERVWQRPPTQEELAGLIDAWVREEILYREGVALGLGRDDPVIRRRVAQKLDFISGEFVADTVTDEEMQTWLDEHEEEYRLEPVYSLRQVYVDPARHGDAVEDVLEGVRQQLGSGESEGVGDATMLPAVLGDASASEIARVFGRDFASGLADLPVGAWSGPIGSGYGLHFVRIDERTPGRAAELQEVRTAVERDLIAARRASAREAQFEALRSRYTIVLPDEFSGGTVAASER